MGSRGGFAEKQGLKIEIQQFKGDTLALKSLLAGELDSYEGNPGSPMTVTGLGVRDAADIDRVLADFAREPNGGLIVTPSPLTATKRDVIIANAAKLRLPAMYSFRFYVASGGLVSYGIDQLETVREAASYVDRILRGANPADLPVQLPTKFSLVVNLKTAKELGLTIAESFLLFADEVIE